ncbi:MAG TPA: hypothetical protein PLV19_04165 [Nitrosomonas sp.]|nr:hypothetical protein [Nitrosomonas sp.]HQX13350.1 hypothetical protein [Nitrosomonas sp.]HRB31739.1 hypothetical protein [Nitrosomonas sp.]HRB44421.1 hypothetical protein [Nitrosomonas sp.]HRB77979.1 hypothetical protein [Nitrosomonas sp.]
MKTLLVILLVLPFVTACISGPSKGQLDAEVRRLCAIDGGIKVYEMVKLPAERFDQHGQIRIPYKENLKPKDEYYKVWHVSYIKNGNPSLSRDHFQIVRQSDSKVLGESISYVRIGGDIPGPWHGSSFRCPENAGSPFLTRQIFIRSNGE